MAHVLIVEDEMGIRLSLKIFLEEAGHTVHTAENANEALGMAAALATLQEFKEKNVPAHMYKVGQRLIDGLNNICQNHKMDGVAAYGDPVASMPRLTWKKGKVLFDNEEQNYFFAQCYRYGLFFHRWHVAFVNYSHKNRDIDEALDICDFAMARTKRKFRK